LVRTSKGSFMRSSERLMGGGIVSIKRFLPCRDLRLEATALAGVLQGLR
jgi:hypothetical protein